MVLLAQFHRMKVAKDNGRLAVGCSRNIDQGSASEGECPDDDHLDSTLLEIPDKRIALDCITRSDVSTRNLDNSGVMQVKGHVVNPNRASGGERNAS